MREGTSQCWYAATRCGCSPAAPSAIHLSRRRNAVEVGGIVETTAAREHRAFAGNIDKSKLGFGERAIVRALRVPVGDSRDWDEIRAWATDIARALRREIATM